MSVAFKLYELSESMNQVAYMIEEGVEGLEETLESIECSFQEKAESILKLWRSKLAERDAIKSEIYRLQQRSEKLDKDANWLHSYVETEMIRTGLIEVKSHLFKAAVSLSPPRVEVMNINDLPEPYVRVKMSQEADKVAIKAALDRGEFIPGCEIKRDLRLKVK